MPSITFLILLFVSAHLITAILLALLMTLNVARMIKRIFSFSSASQYKMSERQKQLLGLTKDYNEGQDASPVKRMTPVKRTPVKSASPGSAAKYFSSSPLTSPSKYTPQKSKEAEVLEYSPSSFLMVGTLNYKPSPLPTFDSKPSTEAKSALSTLPFDSAIKQLSIANLEASINNLREWISKRILQPLSSDISELDEKFISMGYVNYCCRHAIQSNSELIVNL